MTPAAKEKWLLAATFGVMVVMGFCFVFSVRQMPDESLRTASPGSESEAVQKGEWILSYRWPRTTTLAVGDLVWLKAHAERSFTLRRIERVIPPQPLTGRQPSNRLARSIRDMDVQPKFVVAAFDGSDRQEVWPSRITGKAAHVFRTK